MTIKTSRRPRKQPARVHGRPTSGKSVHDLSGSKSAPKYSKSVGTIVKKDIKRWRKAWEELAKR